MSNSKREVDDICVVTHPLSTTGEEKTRDLLDVLSAFTGVSLITAALDRDSDLRTDYTVIDISQQGTGNTILTAAIRFLFNQIKMCVEIQRRPEDTVLFYGATSYLLPVLWSKLIGKTVILEPRADVPLSLRITWEQQVPSIIARTLAKSVWTLERIGYHVCDGIVTYSPGMAEQLELNVFEEKLYTNGARFIDTDRFRIDTPYSERPQSVGFIGRIDEEKGIRTLAAVAQRLPEDITFRFVGDGPLRSWLETELSEEISSGQVEITGWVDHSEIQQEFNELRLVVMPSEPTEGLPTTILEAMACGTPVYATPVSGVPDVVRDGQTGFLMKNKDSDAIADEIERILEDNNLDSISEVARRLAEEKYNFEAAVERYKKYLRKQ